MAVGLVMNPVAGLGGPAGLKGSDGVEVQAQARRRGAVERAQERTAQALRLLPPGTTVLTAAGPMGADACAQVPGLDVQVCHTPGTPSTGDDTVAAAAAVADRGAALILFAGGDGTARDVLRGLTQQPVAGGADTPILGIPCGVKMYSGVFAVSPAAAGRVAAAIIGPVAVSIEQREVLDISEEQIRAGHVQATLFGTVSTPVVLGRTQSRKAATGESEADAIRGVAVGLAAQLLPGHTYFLGPGSTMAALAAVLGVPKTPLGVDVIRDGRLLLADASEPDLLGFTAEGPCHAVVTSIGGQGFLLGRGNQQFGPDVLRALTAPTLLVGATTGKLTGLAGPLLIDTGDTELDTALAGPRRVTTGPQDTAVIRAVAASADQKGN